MKKVFVFTDGGARGNPGPAAVGVVIKTEENEFLAEISRKIGKTSNNVAEYKAVITALEWLKNNLHEQALIFFYSDSNLVVNQLNGYFKVKNPAIRNFLLKIRLLEQEIGGEITYAHIPREKNKEADALVNKALDS